MRRMTTSRLSQTGDCSPFRSKSYNSPQTLVCGATVTGRQHPSRTRNANQHSSKRRSFMANPRISSETSIRELYAALAAADAAQGTVAASAVAAGMGVSLLVMVAALPTTRIGSIDDRKALTGATKALLNLQRQLAATIDVETTGRLI